jgi:hypothetical protein
VPPDSVRCTRGLQAKLRTFGNSQRRFTIIHRIVRCTTGQCPVPQGRASLNSPASGIRSAKIHRTCPVHTGLSGVPPDSVRCTRGLQAKLRTFGNSQRRFTIIHRTVRCTTGQCPMLQRRATLNSPASGIRSAIIHRTCPVHTGLSGEPAEQRLLRAQRSTATH